jgi:hypothetical protein
MNERNAGFKGFNDLCYMPALYDPRLNPFDFFWIVEADVDFSGNWNLFFELADASGFDLIGSYLDRFAPDDGWVHWRTLKTPSDVHAESRMRGFFPLGGMSRRFLEVYVEEVARPGWSGHFEAIYGTLANHHGLRSVAIAPARGQPGLVAPKPKLKVAFPLATIETFNAGPAVGTEYFHERPSGFAVRNHLYHPIKVST